MRRSETNIYNNNRIEVVDVLRGFALLGIFLRHFISRFDYSYGTHAHNRFLSKIDRFIEAADYHFLLDKTYPIFALLFGFSMFLVEKSSGEKSPTRSFQRLLSLIPFACLNAIFFPDGDILGLYVMVGLIVLLFVKLPSKWLPYIAVFFLLQPLIWIQMVINFFDGNFSIISYNSSSYIKDVESTIANGTILDIIWTNLTKGQIGNFLWALEVGRISQTIGLILLGFYLGKSGRFEVFIGRGTRNLRYLIIPFLIIIGSMMFGKYALETPVAKEVTLLLSNWSGLSFAFIYIILIIFIYQIFPAHYFSPLRFYGRMSLTNYISQSIIGGILFAPFALNGAAYLSTTSIVVLFTIVTVGQILFSKYWLNKNHYGPLELYWRRMSLYSFK
ncbi:DUF418 domain-containing protein [Niabella sp. 22666]|uniref:DUF418 domain-containing protein n=1 Tax=Niabella sp. 22666 TaxID=3453954 RepID=UPI003F860B17